MAIIQTTLNFLRTDTGSFSTQDRLQSKLKITSITKLAFIFLYCFSVYTTQAQVITNGGFENLDSIAYKKYGLIPSFPYNPEPLGGWNNISSNSASLTNFAQPILEIASQKFINGSKYDSGIVLRNFINDKDTVIGYLTNSSFLPDLSIGGCICIINNPEKRYRVVINYKYNTPEHDSAYLRVVYKNNGRIIIKDLTFYLPKTPNNLFVRKELWTGILTEIGTDFVYYLRTSNPLSPNNISKESVLTVKYILTDDGNFTCDRHFNIWKDAYYLNPISWVSHKGYHAGHRDAYLGKGALALSGLQLENGEVEPYTERNYQVDKLGNAKGGAAYSLNADTLLGYYKFKGNAQSARVRLMLLKNQQMIFDSFITIASNGSEYTPFMLPFNVATQPDTLRIEIISNNPIPANGDTLLLDEIQMASARLKTNIQKINQVQANFGFYPNPTSGILYPINPQTTEQAAEIHITDMLGKKLKTFNPNSTELSIIEFPAGIYFLHLQTNKQARFTQKIVKE